MKNVLLLIFGVLWNSLLLAQPRSTMQFKPTRARQQARHLAGGAQKQAYNFQQVPKLNIQAIQSWPVPTRPSSGSSFTPTQIPRMKLMPMPDLARIKRDPKSGLPIYLKAKTKNGNAPVNGKTTWNDKIVNHLNEFKKELKIRNPEKEFKEISRKTDRAGHLHIRLQQVKGDAKVYGGEMIIHAYQDEIYSLNGRFYPTPAPKTAASLSKSQALEIAQKDIQQHSKWVNLDNSNEAWLAGPQLSSELIIYHPNMNPEEEVYAWKLELQPNLKDRWVYILDAATGQILKKFNQTCSFMGIADHSCASHKAEVRPSTAVVEDFDGPAVARSRDLFNIERQLNTYDVNGQFLLLDASRPMFNAQRTNIPDDIIGGIVTFDARRSSPQNEDFNFFFLTANDNRSFDPVGVSAHYNAGICYEYFLNTFGRNSIDGEGGSLYSLINVVDVDSTDFDNAFWNGAAMFYGTGNFFDNFAKALDIAGHEISHGVIQHTAELEYIFQSGALNESFADIFGTMIDRDDWGQGEDITPRDFFPTGVVRDLSNPNNGGSRLGDRGWQPAHMDEFVELPDSIDNGGVHINSGIPNFAFFKFASAVGRDIAEQVFYHALENSLVRTSQFIDLRIAVLQSAGILYNQNVVNAARNAFDEVGIMDGEATQAPEVFAENPGDEFVLFSDQDNTALYLFTPDGQAVVNPFQGVPGALRPPSVTDDGSIIVYVATDNTLRFITIDWNTSQLGSGALNEEPIWANAAISKDGSRLAATFNDQSNQIRVFDLNNGTSKVFELFNPTFTEGVTTGDVAFADVLQWDFSGEWLLYDALNEIEGSNGTLSYWDIGFINVWDNQSGDYADGFIQKLFPSLGEGISIGNPTFSKNNPNILAFEIADFTEGDFTLVGLNLFNGDQVGIFRNSVPNVPNFTKDDTKITFDALDGNDNAILAQVDLAADGLTPAGDALIRLGFQNIGIKWGINFANGIRDFSGPVNVNEAFAKDYSLNIYPNPTSDILHLAMNLPENKTLQVEVYNMLGKSVLQTDWGNNRGELVKALDLNALDAGTYTIKLRVGQELAAFRISKL